MDLRNITSVSVLFAETKKETLAAYKKALDKEGWFRWIHISAVTSLLSVVPRSLLKKEYYYKIKDKNYVLFLARGEFDSGTDIVFRNRGWWISQWHNFELENLSPSLQEKVSKIIDKDGNIDEDAVKLIMKLIRLKVFL